MFVIHILSIVARKFASETLSPLVKQMDEESHMPDTLLKAFFENGVCNILLLSISMSKKCNILSLLGM